MKLLHQIPLEDETHRRFKAHAAMLGKTMTDLVVGLIEKELEGPQTVTEFEVFTAEDGNVSIRRKG